MSRIKEITPADLSRLMERADHFELVDIRTPAEVERGVIPSANVLAMNQIPLNLDFFSISRKQIVIYCRTGSRSAQVCRFLNKQGINNVINLRGGLVKWVSNGLPLDPEPVSTIA
ncbi:MAG: rhodanese-related sulfurtransferase [Gammaproteobacteria bacterium]|jgi:rhodanese-related sulfurtransferase